jgi:hypothetical protein
MVTPASWASWGQRRALSRKVESAKVTTPGQAAVWWHRRRVGPRQGPTRLETQTHLQRVQTLLHDLSIFDLLLLVQELVAKWIADHDAVAAERRGEVDALLGHHLRSGLVDQVAVLDAHDAVVHRMADGLARVRVGRALRSAGVGRDGLQRVGWVRWVHGRLFHLQPSNRRISSCPCSHSPRCVRLPCSTTPVNNSPSSCPSATPCS